MAPFSVVLHFQIILDVLICKNYLMLFAEVCDFNQFTYCWVVIPRLRVILKVPVYNLNVKSTKVQYLSLGCTGVEGERCIKC